jgi:hypothetical protein
MIVTLRRIIGPLILVGACGGDAAGPVAQSGIHVIDGAHASDTVLAIRSQALIVEVRNIEGSIAPVGTIARFTATNASVAPLTTSSFSSFLALPVDDAGRVAVVVRLGTVAGAGRVVVSVPEFGLVDTASYVVLPGSPARVTLAPADTLLTLGQSFTYRGGVTDQFGNVRQDPMTWIVDPGATVTAAGVVSPAGTGRYKVTATTNVGGVSRSGSAMVSAVPILRIAAWRNGKIVLMNIDGGNSREIATAADGGIGENLEWMPNRASIIYSTYTGGFQTLYVADTTGNARPFFGAPVPNVSHQAEPRVSRDGQWVVFAGFDSRCFGYCLYRARSDGTAPELLSTSPVASNPVYSPSPDGSRIALVAAGSVRVFDVATKTFATWSQPGGAPTWSPDGTKIALVRNGTLTLIAADGSVLKTLQTSPRSETPRMSWLSDSRFILARSIGGRFDLIDSENGTEIPLTFSFDIGAMSVR